MQEEIIVHNTSSIPRYMPKMVNPIYKAAQTQKNLRKEALIEIMIGNIPEGLKPFMSVVGTLSYEEKMHILGAWKDAGLNDLVAFYYDYLANELYQVEDADRHYLNYLEEMKKNKGRG